MAQSDTIADLLVRLKNAVQARHRFVDVPASREKLNIMKVIEQQGFVEKVILSEEKYKIRIFLKYAMNRTPVLQGTARISSPGQRRYVGCREIPKVFGGLGIAVISTSKGIVDGETARKEKLGGELLCYVW